MNRNFMDVNGMSMGCVRMSMLDVNSRMSVQWMLKITMECLSAYITVSSNDSLELES